jgi:hypothetical protein
MKIKSLQLLNCLKKVKNIEGTVLKIFCYVIRDEAGST